MVNLPQFPAEDKFKVFVVQKLRLVQDADCFRFDKWAGLVARIDLAPPFWTIQKVIGPVQVTPTGEV